jgi:hypothetical protein
MVLMATGPATGGGEDSSVDYWRQKWTSGTPPERVEALRWFSERYLRAGLPRPSVEEVLGVAELARGGSFVYVEPQTEAMLTLTYECVRGDCRVKAFRFIPRRDP